MQPSDYPRLAISAGLLLLFSFAFIRNPTDQLLIGSLISMASLAANYYLGSSKGAADANSRTEKLIDIQHAQSQAPTGAPGDPVSVVEQEPRP